VYGWHLSSAVDTHGTVIYYQISDCSVP